MDRFKKEVGFIKSSSKKNIQYQEGSQSSDSFSSFQYDPTKDKQSQFSPYKHPTLKEQSFRLHSNPKIKSENNPILSNQHHNPPKFSNLILRNNFTVQTKDKRQDQSIKRPQLVGHHQYKKYKLQGHDEVLCKQSDEQFEQELSLSNLHKFQKSRQNKQAQNQTGQIEDRQTKQIGKYKKYIEQSSSENQQQHQINIENKPTFNYTKHKKLQEQLITEYDKKQFKDKSIKAAILLQNKQNPIKNKGAYQTKGGICFELDTRQFKGNPKNTDLQMNRKKKKKQESDPKVLLMQRRQTAKNYDRQARYKLFGY